jgi:hypothetical protein
MVRANWLLRAVVGSIQALQESGVRCSRYSLVLSHRDQAQATAGCRDSFTNVCTLLLVENRGEEDVTATLSAAPSRLLLDVPGGFHSLQAVDH